MKVLLLHHNRYNSFEGWINGEMSREDDGTYTIVNGEGKPLCSGLTFGMLVRLRKMKMFDLVPVSKKTGEPETLQELYDRIWGAP
jgi:hypothetical protein